MRLLRFACVILAAFFLPPASAWQVAWDVTGVRVLPLPDQSIYPDSIAPDALAFACARDPLVLARFFAERQLPYDENLVRSWRDNAACHIYYEPTVPGFRASRDNAKIRVLYAPIHALNFLVGSDMPGHNLDIVKSVLGRLPRPTIVRLSVAGSFDEDLFARASETNFSGTPHDVSFFSSGSAEMHPWAQDQLKAGQVSGRLRVLIPRRLFEGRAEDGDLTDSLISRFEQEGFTRSKLSWEGGGLQFVANPKNPAETIMAVGLRRYWGPDLTDSEYRYVLSVEFGGDLILDLTPIGLHSDYAVSFLPQDNTALVSRIVRDSPDLARAAAFALLDTFGDEKPPSVRQLASLLAQWSGSLASRPLPIMRAITDAHMAIDHAAPERDVELDALVARYVAANCPGQTEACFAAENEMLRKDPELVRRTSSYALAITAETRLRQTLLGIVESQTSPAAPPQEPFLDDAARQLTNWGFRVVRIPLLSSGSSLPVSYANSLLFDHRLFMPTLGLGRYEERVAAQLRSDLGGQYDIIPVDARRSLTLNGGLHCIFGILREIEPLPAAASAQ